MLNMTQYGYTKREIKQLSSPACSPQYTVTIPKGTRVRLPVVAVIPGDTEHEGFFPEDTEVVDVFSPPREDFLAGGTPSYMRTP